MEQKKRRAANECVSRLLQASVWRRCSTWATTSSGTAPIRTALRPPVQALHLVRPHHTRTGDPAGRGTSKG